MHKKAQKVKFFKTCPIFINAMAMGSPLGPTLVNLFLCYNRKGWLDECQGESKPVFTANMGMIFLYFSKTKNTLNYF